MNQQKVLHSPSFRNVKLKPSLSPKDLKEKMRKDYKSKIQNCRHILLNRFRNTVEESDIRKTFTDIYNNTFAVSDAPSLIIDDWDEEEKVLAEIKQELIREEVDWWLQEYEKAEQYDIDLSTIDQKETVVCPICQKNVLCLKNSNLTCLCGSLKIKTTKSLEEIKTIIFVCIEKHSNVCNSNVNFMIVPEMNEDHIFLICENCNDMQLVL